MPEKLEMRHHKAMLSVMLLVLLFIGVLLGSAVASSIEAITIVIFALIFVLFVLSLVMVSILIRTRDEIHAMHAENERRLQVVREGMKSGKVVKK
jgi:uncharacterized membrane protein YfcA